MWVGDVLIRAAAEGTDTYELNRNLVLTDGARADSVPNLEIETGEIGGRARFRHRAFRRRAAVLPAARHHPDDRLQLVVVAFFARRGSASRDEHLMSQTQLSRRWRGFQ